MCVVCCSSALLFASRCLPLFCLLFVVCPFFLRVECCALVVVGCLLFVVWLACWDSVCWCLRLDVRCVLFVVCCLAIVVCCSLCLFVRC